MTSLSQKSRSHSPRKDWHPGRFDLSCPSLPRPAPSKFRPTPVPGIPTILFADDDPAVRETTVDLLSLTGAQVFAVASGRAASQFLEKQGVDLIITDMAMPDGDGNWLIAWVRFSARHRRTRLVVISAHAAPENIAAGLQAGADDYLIKPFEPQHFLTTVERHLKVAIAAHGNATGAGSRSPTSL